MESNCAQAPMPHPVRMDVHTSAVQTKASKFIQKVSQFKPNFKLSARTLRDDTDIDFHPYPQHHRRTKSDAINRLLTGGARQDDEIDATDSFKPYMSQPLLNITATMKEPLLPEVDARHDGHPKQATNLKSPRGAEQADASLPRAPSSNHVPTTRIAPKLPAAAPNVVRHPASGGGGARDQNPHAEKSTEERVKSSSTANPKSKIAKPAGPREHATTPAKKRDIDDDDVPLIVLKEQGNSRPQVIDISKPSVDVKGPSTSSSAQRTSPRIVISYSEGAGVVKGDASVGMRPFVGSHRDTSIKQQLWQERASQPPPPTGAAAVPSVRVTMADSASSGRGLLRSLPPAGASSASSMRPKLVLTPPQSISPMISRCMSMDKDGNMNSLRFSPTIVTRHPPLPLKLPALPPITPTRETTESEVLSRRKRDSRVGLRSMPALPRTGSGPGVTGHEEEEGDEDEMDDDAEEEGDDDASQSHELGQATSAGTCHTDSSAGSESSERHRSSFTTPWGEVKVRIQEQGAREPPQTCYLRDLPPVDTSRLRFSFLDTPISSTKGKGKGREDFVDYTPTPTDGSQKEYFSTSGGLVDTSSTTVTPNRRLSTPPAQQRINSSTLQPVQLTIQKALPLPPLPDAERPRMYKRGSQSMVDIHLLKPAEEMPSRHDNVANDRHKVGDEAKPATPSRSRMAPIEDVPPSPKILRRRRSLPSYYGPSAPPPPYPTFTPFLHRILVQPREDEGRERLPPYSNDILLKTIMPRKMEFSKPNVQARDRKWRRVICVLEGTMLRVYRCPPRVAGVSAIEGWWEKKVGVGDASSSTSYVTATSIINGPTAREAQSASAQRNWSKHGEEAAEWPDAPPVAVRSVRPSSSSSEPKRSRLVPFLKAPTRHGRSNSDTSHSSPIVVLRSPRGSLNLPRTPLSGSSHSSREASPSHGASSSSGRLDAVTSPERPSTPMAMSGGEEVPDPDASELIRSYSLQNAECGLGLDYAKRKNVIRVKTEGEQFLLQAKDAMEVVGWIEGVQCGTNVALDLDERPMPRGPLFPRRRRRR